MPYCYYTCNLLPLDLVVRSGYSPAGSATTCETPRRAGPPRCAQHPPHDLSVRHQAGRRGRRAVRRRGRRRRRAGRCLRRRLSRGAGRLRRHPPHGRPAGRHLPRPGVRAVHAPVFGTRGRRRHSPPICAAWTTGCAPQRRRPLEPGPRRRRTSRPGSRPPSTIPTPPAARRGVSGRRALERRLPPAPDRTTGRARVRPGVLHLARPLEATGREALPTAATVAGGARDYHRPRPPVLVEIGMCPRRSTADRRDHLVRRLDETRPSSIIYARQSFCDPGRVRRPAGLATGRRSAACPTWRSRWTSPSTPTARCTPGWRPSWRPSCSTTTCSTTTCSEED